MAWSPVLEEDYTSATATSTGAANNTTSVPGFTDVAGGVGNIATANLSGFSGGNALNIVTASGDSSGTPSTLGNNRLVLTSAASTADGRVTARHYNGVNTGGPIFQFRLQTVGGLAGYEAWFYAGSPILVASNGTTVTEPYNPGSYYPAALTDYHNIFVQVTCQQSGGHAVFTFNQYNPSGRSLDSYGNVNDVSTGLPATPDVSQTFTDTGNTGPAGAGNFGVAGSAAGNQVQLVKFFQPAAISVSLDTTSGNPGSYTVHLTGTNTSWTAGTLATVSGVNSPSITSQSINTSTQVITVTFNTGPNLTGSPITLTFGDTTDTATATFVVSSTAPFSFTKPVVHQIYQRSGVTGDIAIAGTNLDTVSHDIEASFNGGAYQTIATAVAGGATFTGTLTGQAAGQGTLTVRQKDTPANVATVLNVSLGDVFALWGQSNMGGRLTNNQVLNNQTLTGNLFTNAYTYAVLTDPTDSTAGQVDSVSNDVSQGGVGGSVWPIVASQLMAVTGVPVGFVPCAMGSTPITSWLPGASHTDRATLYGSGNWRCHQVSGGVKAVLWWQGETDMQSGMSTATYQANLAAIAAAVHADLGVKLMPCKVQTLGVGWASLANQALVNAAIGNEWASDANVLTGPDLSGLVCDGGSGSPHLLSDASAEQAATLWSQAIFKAIYGIGVNTGGAAPRIGLALIGGISG